MSDDSGYETPEACALAGWTPDWQARVIEVERSADTAYVLIDTEPSHPMMVTCGRRDGRWYEVASGSGLRDDRDVPAAVLDRVLVRPTRYRRVMRRRTRGR